MAAINDHDFIDKKALSERDIYTKLVEPVLVLPKKHRDTVSAVEGLARVT